jgi:hypothetical protein
VATQTRTRPTKGRAQGGSCSLPEMKMRELLPEEDVHRPEEDLHRPAPDPYKELAVAVLRQAMADGRRAGQAGEEARRWLRGSDGGIWAQVLDLDPKALCEALGR